MENHKKFGTSPVKNAYWKIYTKKPYLKSNVLVKTLLRFVGCGDGSSANLSFNFNRMEKDMIDVNITEELNELLQVYTDAEEHLKLREEEALRILTICMKQFIEVQDERKSISEKLINLKTKLNPPKDDEGDDE